MLIICRLFAYFFTLCLIILSDPMPLHAAEAPILRALVVQPDSQTGVTDTQPGIDVSRLPDDGRAGLSADLSPLLGHGIDKALLDTATRIVTTHFTALGHPFVDIGFPPQDITDGTLRIVVAEYRIASVSVADNRWFADNVIKTAAGLVPDETIDKSALDRRLSEFGTSPFVKITPEFQPGSLPDTTRVTLHTEDRVPVQAVLGYADSGAASTGWDRWMLGVNAADPALSGAQISYAFVSSNGQWQRGTAADENPVFAQHQASLTLPQPSGDRLTLSGSYARQIPSLGPDLGSLGINTNLGLDYTRPLVRGPASAWGAVGEAVGIGYDFKRSNNNLAFGGLSVQSTYTVLSEFSLHYGAGFPNAIGLLQAQNTLVLSPGNMMPENTTRALRPLGTAQSGTPGAEARYVYDRLTLTQLAPLPHDFGLVLRASLQAASTNLLASEQLSIAGADAVRGYQEFGAAGSQGVVFSTELRGPSFSPSALLTGHDGRDTAQLHIFGDIGRAWNPTASSATPAASRTASLGFGGQLMVAENLSVRLEQGWQLERDNRQGAQGAFLHAAVTMTW